MGTDRDNSEVSDRLFQLDLGSYSQRKYCCTKSWVGSLLGVGTTIILIPHFTNALPVSFSYISVYNCADSSKSLSSNSDCNFSKQT